MALKADFERATGGPFDPPKKAKSKKKKAPATAQGDKEKRGAKKVRDEERMQARCVLVFFIAVFVRFLAGRRLLCTPGLR